MKIFKIVVFSILILGALSFTVDDEEDVVTSFENLLKKHFESYEINQRQKVSRLGGGWVNRRFKTDGEYKYDVQKTNSLISPYTGYCEFTLKELRTVFHNSKEEALLDTNFTIFYLISHKHYYSYQKVKWVVSKRENKGYAGWYDCNEVISEGENKGETNIHGCWEEDFHE